MASLCREKVRNWDPKESHKDNKLDVTLTLTGQKSQASGPGPAKDGQIKSDEDRKAAAIPASGGSSPSLSVYAEGFVVSFSLINHILLLL